jgi:hypothetical protein
MIELVMSVVYRIGIASCGWLCLGHLIRWGRVWVVLGRIGVSVGGGRFCRVLRWRILEQGCGRVRFTFC